MQCVIGKISKKINSTKNTFSGTTHNVVLKGPVSTKNPQILITGTPALNANYMSFNGAYYWIDDIVSETNGLSWVEAHLDPLATYKDSILNSSALVRFGPKGSTTTYMDDPRFGPDEPWTAARKSVTIPGVDIFSRGGCVIITAVAATDLTTNGIVKYIISYTEAMQYMAAFGSTIKTNMDGSADLKEAVSNFIIGATGGGNWSDNIKSMIWVPFGPNDVIAACGASVITEMGIGGYRVSGPALGFAQSPIGVKVVSGTLTIPWENDATTHRFLRLPKYTSMTLCHPCGSVDIDTNSLIDQNTVHYTVAIDMMSGSYYVKIKENANDDAEPLAYAQGSVAMEVTGMIAGGGTVGGMILKAEATALRDTFLPRVGNFIASRPGIKARAVSKMTEDEKKRKTSVIDTTTGIDKNYMITGNAPSSCNATLGGSVLNLYQTSSFGSQFYIQMNAKKPAIMTPVVDPYDNFCDEYGYPVNTYLPLSGITGYVECADVSVNPAGTMIPNEDELSTLNSSLCSGIYIE